MAHLSNPAARNLSLTEELEKLEQTITLTLQEIDHNFSRAHRIVTTSILPIVEQYAEHSRNVWEGSKFWKQFFEASANVSLSGYEDLAADQEQVSVSGSNENTSAYGESTTHLDDHTIRTHDEVSKTTNDNDDYLDEDMETPHVSRALNDPTIQPTFADYPSSYEALKREIKGEPSVSEDTTEILPSTPSTPQRLPDMSMTPGSAQTTTGLLPSTGKKRNDPLLHRILDKNYRVQATPRSGHKTRIPVSKLSWQDAASPMSSPMAPPQLRSDLFNSPRRARPSQVDTPRTPGISVQTPLKYTSQDATEKFDVGKYKDEVTWESDSDEDADGLYKELGMSPPKTIQFALPQSRLLQTPAHEASKRIVDDLLRTAGAADDTDDIDIDLDLDSPAIIKSRDDILDDEF